VSANPCRQHCGILSRLPLRRCQDIHPMLVCPRHAIYGDNFRCSHQKCIWQTRAYWHLSMPFASRLRRGANRDASGRLVADGIIVVRLPARRVRKVQYKFRERRFSKQRAGAARSSSHWIVKGSGLRHVRQGHPNDRAPNPSGTRLLLLFYRMPTGVCGQPLKVLGPLGSRTRYRGFT